MPRSSHALGTGQQRCLGTGHKVLLSHTWGLSWLITPFSPLGIWHAGAGCQKPYSAPPKLEASSFLEDGTSQAASQRHVG